MRPNPNNNNAPVDPAVVLAPPDRSDALRIKITDFKKLIPYTATKNEAGETSHLQSTINPEVTRLIDEMIAKSRYEGVPWKTRGDFIRDAVFQYVVAVYPIFERQGLATPMLRHELEMAREADEIRRRKELFRSTEALTSQVAVLIADGSLPALTEMASKLRSWVAIVESMTDDEPYWSALYARRLITDDNVKRALRWLQTSPFKDETWVIALGRWLDQHGKPVSKAAAL